MNGAVPWYQSRSVLGAIAALILTGLGALNILPADLTQDKLVNFLVVAVPILVALEGRISATKTIAPTAAKAAAVNASVPLTQPTEN